jgi:hypothetical protein
MAAKRIGRWAVCLSNVVVVSSIDENHRLSLLHQQLVLLSVANGSLSGHDNLL